mgnify:CR=1 FL=1
MIKLRLVFLIVFVFVILIPTQQYLNLSEQRDLFVEASQIRSKSSEKIIAPRKTIVDRNQNDLAISIQRPTLIFKSGLIVLMPDVLGKTYPRARRLHSLVARTLNMELTATL